MSESRIKPYRSIIGKWRLEKQINDYPAWTWSSKPQLQTHAYKRIYIEWSPKVRIILLEDSKRNYPVHETRSKPLTERDLFFSLITLSLSSYLPPSISPFSLIFVFLSSSCPKWGRGFKWVKIGTLRNQKGEYIKGWQGPWSPPALKPRNMAGTSCLHDHHDGTRTGMAALERTEKRKVELDKERESRCSQSSQYLSARVLKRERHRGR